ncbi:YfhO family protein [Parablautia muri]|uniref:YfhO family protein n=1 Tax=Parablautia muri TaxID=2320879 RepID=UPI0013683777|nr:YfhO family protein [Parablautia muri]
MFFLPFIVRGNSFISGADGFNQTYPAYVYISNYIKELFKSIFAHESISTFDFSIGFGNDIITTLNSYGIGDIFYITAFLSSEPYSEILLTLTVLLKIYMTGISFSVWGRYHKLSSPSLLAASIFYAFNGYTYAFELLFPAFIIAQLTLPLFILGLDMLIESKQIWKVSKLLIISIFLQALNGFYFLYMETLFAILYFGVKFFVLYNKQWKSFFLRACNAAWQYLLGIGMASLFFIPVLLDFLKSPRSEETSFSFAQIIEMYSLETWTERLEGLISGPGYGSGLGLCAVAVASILFLYSIPHKYKELKILLTIFVVGYCFPMTGSIMNGFSYSTERLLFLLYFLIAMVIAKSLSQPDHIPRQCFYIQTFIFVIWGIALFALSGVNLQSILRIAAFGFSWLSLIYILIRKPKSSFMANEKLLSMLAVVGIILVGVMNNFPVVVGGKGFSALFLNWGVYQDINDSKFAQCAKKDSLTENALRTDIYDTCHNAATILNVNGTSSYYSIANPSVYYFLTEYLVSPGIEDSSFTYKGLDSRLSLEMLLSVGSYTDTIDASKIYTNPYILPFGFTFDSYILNEDAQSEDVLDRNAALVETVTLKNSPKVVICCS